MPSSDQRFFAIYHTPFEMFFTLIRCRVPARRGGLPRSPVYRAVARHVAEEFPLHFEKREGQDEGQIRRHSHG